MAFCFAVRREKRNTDEFVHSLTWKVFFFFFSSGVFKLTGPASSLLSRGELGCVWEADQMNNQIAAVCFLFGPVPELAPPISLC